MTYSDKNIVKTYSKLFEGLSADSKIELIENLSKSLTVNKKINKKNQENKFYWSFGAFASVKSAEEIIGDIKSSREFRKKAIKF